MKVAELLILSTVADCRIITKPWDILSVKYIKNHCTDIKIKDNTSIIDKIVAYAKLDKPLG